MRSHKSALAAVTLGLALTTASVLPAEAAYVSGNCTVSGLQGGLGVYYSSYSSAYWVIDSTIYQLAPADSSSDQNNVSHTLFGGSDSALLRKTPTADRDNKRYTLYNHTTTNFIGRKGGTAYVNEKVVFDKFGDDPDCSKKVYLP